MNLQVVPYLKLRPLWFAIGMALIMLVVYLSLTSSPIDTGLDFPYQDKLYHAFAYFVLMAWFGQIYHTTLQRSIFAVLFVVLGLAMEYMQSFDPKRMAEFADMVANTTGVLIGYMLTATTFKNVLLNIERKIFS